MKRICILVFLAIAGFAGELPPAEQAAIDRISADSLRTNLSFLSSDDLEGRLTPSPGLDRAAEYIAAQFRRAGLEPATADRTWFQIAKFDRVTPDLTGFRMVLQSGEQRIDVPWNQVWPRSLTALDFENAPVIALPPNGAVPSIEGAIVAGSMERYGDEVLLETLQSRKPALILLFDKSGKNARAGEFLDDLEQHRAPILRIRDSEALDFLRRTPHFTLTLHLAQPAVSEVSLRNVAGLLPGSDPALRGEYVLLTAHYDHLGRTAKGIFNGANDNGSGTVSVIEIANALGHSILARGGAFSF